MPVEHAQRLAALVDETEELVVETGVLQGELPVVVVDVEHAALRTGGGRGLRLVDRGRYAVDVQDPGERQPAEPRADDRDGGGHGVLPSCRPKTLERRSSHLGWNVVPGTVKLEWRSIDVGGGRLG